MLTTDVTPAAANRNITHEDFLDQIRRVEPADTPVYSFSKTIVKLKATERKWNVDLFPGPKGAVGRADGTDAGTGRNWSSNMRPVSNLAQGFDEQFGIGWIADSVPQIAGVSDPLAYSKASAYMLLKQHTEVAIESSDQVAVVESAGIGSLFASYKSMIDPANAYTAATAFATGKAPDNCSAPSGAMLTGAMTSVVTRAAFKTIALALRQTAKREKRWMLAAGLSLRQQITDMTLPAQVTVTATAATAQASIAPTALTVYTRAEDDATLGASIDIIVTDWGQIRVIPTDYIGTTTTSAAGTAITNVNSAASARALSTWITKPKYGLIFDPENLFFQWGVPFFTEELGRTGSGRTFDSKGYCMLGVSNTSLGGYLTLT